MCYQSIVELPIKHIVNVVILERQQRSQFNIHVSFKAKNYIKSLPKVQKKDFASILKYASPLGKTVCVVVYKVSCVCIGGSSSISHVIGSVMVFVLFYLLLSIIHSSDFSG